MHFCRLSAKIWDMVGILRNLQHGEALLFPRKILGRAKKLPRKDLKWW